jgi:hypothetical protein
VFKITGRNMAQTARIVETILMLFSLLKNPLPMILNISAELASQGECDRLELTQAHIPSIFVPDRWYLIVKMLGLNGFNYRMPHGIPQITRI